MIIGVDIGGTKTLLACFAENGKMLKEVRFGTDSNYDKFLKDLARHAKSIETSKAKIACVAVPGLLDRVNGRLIALGNLPWINKNIVDDLRLALGIKQISIENDSKLAGTAEAHNVSEKYSRVYYITLSTGIGGTLVIEGKLADQVIDGEIGMVPVLHDGAMTKWEDIASGRAFYEKYKQRAADVDDPKIWEEFSHNIGFGISMICCIYQVDAIIFGGGLGKHLAKFKQYLTPYVSTYLHSTIRRPQALLTTHYGDNSVIYGCYEYAKDQLTKH